MSTTEAPTAVSTAAPDTGVGAGDAPAGTAATGPEASTTELDRTALDHSDHETTAAAAGRAAQTAAPGGGAQPAAPGRGAQIEPGEHEHVGELGPTAEFAPVAEPAREITAAHLGGSPNRPSPADLRTSFTTQAGPVSTPPASATGAGAAGNGAASAVAGSAPGTSSPVAISPVRTRRPMRADARRNYDRLLAAADAAFTQHGAEASLEDIARRAAVGIGTLYRHFPTRQILLEATFGGRLDSLRDEADTLASTTAPMSALVSWLRSLLHYVTEFRGLSELVMTSMRNRNSDLHASGAGMRRAGGRLLARAQETGEVRPDLDDADLILMVNGIVWAAERVPGEDHTQRLLSVMIEGLRPSHAMA